MPVATWSLPFLAVASATQGGGRARRRSGQVRLKAAETATAKVTRAYP
jgi:hypothetical protein